MKIWKEKLSVNNKTPRAGQIWLWRGTQVGRTTKKVDKPREPNFIRFRFSWKIWFLHCRTNGKNCIITTNRVLFNCPVKGIMTWLVGLWGSHVWDDTSGSPFRKASCPGVSLSLINCTYGHIFRIFWPPSWYSSVIRHSEGPFYLISCWASLTSFPYGHFDFSTSIVTGWGNRKAPTQSRLHHTTVLCPEK